MLTSLVTYQVFLTRNSEYHLQGHVCIGVRDRRTGRWLDQHPALQRPLATTVRTAGQLAPLQKPQLGESLEFDLDGAPLRTSAVLNIEERGGTSQRSVMAPRAAAGGGGLSATFPAMPPLPKPAANDQGAKGVAAKAKAKSKASRWLFRRRPRVSTAERNLAQAQAQAEKQELVTAAGTVRVRAAAQERRFARWRASWIRGRGQAALLEHADTNAEADQSGVHPAARPQVPEY